jgi:hypothetical protein
MLLLIYQRQLIMIVVMQLLQKFHECKHMFFIEKKKIIGILENIINNKDNLSSFNNLNDTCYKK